MFHFRKNRFVLHFKTDSWGSSIMIMEKKGKAFARLYWYNDDNTTVYLDMLSVDIKVRNKGIGTELQKMREEIGINMGAITSYLWVIKDSWMHDWYQRRGYVDDEIYVDDENAIWMKKSLKSI
jgi:hypothetical protein